MKKKLSAVLMVNMLVVLAGCNLTAPTKSAGTIGGNVNVDTKGSLPIGTQLIGARPTVAGVPMTVAQAVSFKGKSAIELEQAGLTPAEIVNYQKAVAVAAKEVNGLTIAGQPLSPEAGAVLRGKTPADLAAAGFTADEAAKFQQAIVNVESAAPQGGTTPGNVAANPGAIGGTTGSNPGTTGGDAGAVGATGGTGDAGAVAGDNVAIRNPKVAGYLKDAQAMQIIAANGGSYASADGSLIATIPPGALSGDTNIRIARVDTSEFPVPNVFEPGIRFAADLGGAYINADQQVMVKVKADERTIADWKARDPQFSTDKYNLSQDASGVWYMAMPMKGPASASDPAPLDEAAARAQFELSENGSLQIPAGPATANRYTIQNTWAQDQFEANFHRPAPNNMSEWFAYEWSGLYGCGSIESHCWGLQLLHDLGWGVPEMHCAGATPPVVVANLPAHVTWTSDDPAVNGTAASGVTVNFAMAQDGHNGAQEISTDGSGNATTHGPVGNSAKPVAYTTVLGARSSAAVACTIQKNMGAVQLTLPKNSPRITIKYDAVNQSTNDLVLRYTLDGKAGLMNLDNTANTQDGSASFNLIVPDDNNHTFAVVDVLSDNGHMEKAPASQAVHRQGGYSFSVHLMAPDCAAK